ncbi:MAG TPA: ABC transporter permease [Kiritimatiellia bacterium]|nr:ABC transporter permease [Kiritimatiellia bacterium]HOR97736.1 ABC transporter permease [Kiritimatiellia bacterium]HPW75562.1 ABC transporter permease [Kiritimatiellia bacterium]HRU18947.1 ABC transporter permease [Kiritimatiellia bacterium]
MLGIWVKRSLRYYGLRQVLFAATAALTTAILSAALLTGESLRRTLARGVTARLGTIRSVILRDAGPFPATLADRLPDTQAVLLLNGELLTSEGIVCDARAQILGAGGESADRVDTDRVWMAALNARGRAQMPLSGEAAIRFAKPRVLPAELPLGAARETRMVRRAVRAGPVADEPTRPPEDFALWPGSVPPVNVRVPLEPLAHAAGVPGMANLLLSTLAPRDLERALTTVLTPEDAGLTLTPIGDGGLPTTLLKSRAVYLPRALPAVLARAGLRASEATFHLVDAFEAGERSTPYGFVAGLTPGTGPVPQDLREDEVVLNAWLAEMLGVETNGTLTLRWRRFEAGGRLVEDQRTFRVRAVTGMTEAASVKTRMPVFPGLEGVDRCAAWDVGMPMDEEKLNDAANEAYWDAWRETPKAFLTYETAKRGFGTLFGEAMSVCVSADTDTVSQALRGLSPVQAGFTIRPVWDEGLRAAQGTTDFRLLFTGMACVLMIAALTLSGLSLALALETRKHEAALFRAVGWSRSRVAAMLAAEWGVPLVAGTVAGAGLGAGLSRALVWGLGRFWKDAFAGAETVFLFSWPTALSAVGIGLLLTAAVMFRTVTRMTACPPVALWQSADAPPAPATSVTGRALRENALGAAMAVAALMLMVAARNSGSAAGAFFGAGFLLMFSLLLFFRTACARLRREEAPVITSPVAAGVVRTLTTPHRSTAVVLLLACGIFLTLGVLSMRQDPAAGCEHTWSGSGGFASIVSSATPLDRERGLALARRVSGSQGVVPLRVREGDEAGCLNMSLPQSPRLIGLDTRAMARARAFEPRDAGGVWSLLDRPLPDGSIPALAADQAMLRYSLKARADPVDGTVYTYTGAGGETWRVRLVGALPVRSGILQGALLVDEHAFMRMFPAEGYRLWLCDYAPYLLREAADRHTASSPKKNVVGEQAVARLRHPEPGVTVETVAERLRLLGSMEHAYLDLFLVLGGLGLILGVAGMALTFARGMAERRGELALLNAAGLSRRVVLRLLLAEHGVTVAAGLIAGILPALVAIRPAAQTLHSDFPWRTLTLLLFLLATTALLSIYFSIWVASRRIGPDALKDEA